MDYGCLESAHYWEKSQEIYWMKLQKKLKFCAPKRRIPGEYQKIPTIFIIITTFSGDVLTQITKYRKTLTFQL